MHSFPRQAQYASGPAIPDRRDNPEPMDVEMTDYIHDQREDSSEGDAQGTDGALDFNNVIDLQSQNKRKADNRTGTNQQSDFVIRQHSQAVHYPF